MGVGYILFGGVAENFKKRRQDVVLEPMDARGRPKQIFETTK